MTCQFIRDFLSPGLRELLGYYSNRLSYEEIERLVERVTGEKLISDQKACQLVTNKAVEISSVIEDKINLINSRITSDVKIASNVNIYNPKAEEVLLFDDGISVREQKDIRNRYHQKSVDEAQSWPKSQSFSDEKKVRKNVITDVVLLEIAKGKFEYIISPINDQGKLLFPLEKSIKAQLKVHYHNYNNPVPIVAIVDGASTIRKHLNNLSPVGITTILDWYHLCKKVREFLDRDFS